MLASTLAALRVQLLAEGARVSAHHQALLAEPQVPSGRAGARRVVRRREAVLPDRDAAAAHRRRAHHALLHADGACATPRLGQQAPHFTLNFFRTS